MLHKKRILAFFFLAIVLSIKYADVIAQPKSLPLDVTCRKSLLRGSYVLQLHNTSSNNLAIWLEARGSKATLLIPPGKTKEIGWIQGFKFDANDVFFVGADGYDTIKQAMPNSELSHFRIGFAKNGGLSIRLSQSYLQSLLPKYLELPVNQAVSNAFEVRVVEIPKIVLKDRSDRLFANVLIHAIITSGKIDIPIHTSLSFIPLYDPVTGTLFASQTKVESTEITLVPKEWMEDVTKFVNEFMPVWMPQFQIYQMDKTALKYCRFFNVREINIQDGRIEIVIL